MGYSNVSILKGWAGAYEDSDLEFTVDIEVLLDEAVATKTAAFQKAQSIFLECAGSSSKHILGTRITSICRNVLFTSVKISYIIEITGTEESVIAYHMNNRSSTWK